MPNIGSILNIGNFDVVRHDITALAGLLPGSSGTGDCADSGTVERVYVAYRALSIDNVSVMAKRDAPSTFAVNFRLLPGDTSGSYGKIIDRTWTPA